MKTEVLEKCATCLLIEDDIDDQEIFLMCLQKITKDIQCDVVGACDEALELLKSRPEFVPDCIFVDVNMPRINGVECLKQLRAIDRLKNTPIYMYSTSSENSVVLETKKAGATDFIVKPVKTSDLKEKLAEIFESCLRDKNEFEGEPDR